VQAAATPPPAGAAAPLLAGMAPDHGYPAATVRVTGRNLLGLERVSFGGTPARFTPVSDTEFTVVVPDGASGSLKINAQTSRWLTPGETAGRFTIDVPPAPVIDSFAPGKGKGNDQVVLRGRNFHWIEDVKFGRYTATAWNVDSPNQITVRVPPQALPGTQPIVVNRALRGGPAAPARAPGRFRIEPSAPVVTGIRPLQSRPGHTIIIRGAGFTRNSTRVLFNHLPSPSVTRLSRTELRAEVPSGASAGPVEVQTRQAPSAFSADSFRLDANPALGADVFVDQWYITQGTQDNLGSVPLVAGRDGLLRVFVRANGRNAYLPDVRVTITGGTASPWIHTIPAPRPQVPVDIWEGILGDSWNLDIPGAILARGARIQLELDPAAAVPHADRSGNAQVMALDVRHLPPLQITLVPVAHDGVQGDVYRDGRTLEDWKQALYELYPVANLPGGIDLKVAPVFTTALNLDQGAGHYPEAGWQHLIDVLDAERVRMGETGRIYVAVLHLSGGSHGLTMGTFPATSRWPVCLVWDQNPAYKGLFAHEVGHALGLLHAPFRAPDNVKGYWPEDPKYDEANIGVYGYDLLTRSLKDPATFKDIMSYGAKRWISDFSYKRVIQKLEEAE